MIYFGPWHRRHRIETLTGPASFAGPCVSAFTGTTWLDAATADPMKRRTSAGSAPTVMRTSTAAQDLTRSGMNLAFGKRGLPGFAPIWPILNGLQLIGQPSAQQPRRHGPIQRSGLLDLLRARLVGRRRRGLRLASVCGSCGLSDFGIPGLLGRFKRLLTATPRRSRPLLIGDAGSLKPQRLLRSAGPVGAKPLQSPRTAAEASRRNQRPMPSGPTRCDGLGRKGSSRRGALIAIRGL